MEKLTTRYLMLSIVLGFTTLLVFFLSYDTFYKADAAIKAVKNIPLQLGPWKGRDVPLDKRVYDILETKAILNRNYVSNGKAVFLSLVYYPDTKVDFHAPEACLAGRGVKVDKSPRSVSILYNGKNVTINLNELIRKENGADVLFFYFYKAGGYVGRDYLRLRMNIAMNKFVGKWKSGALIRVSTPIIEGDQEMAFELLTNFIQALYPYLP